MQSKMNFVWAAAALAIAAVVPSLGRAETLPTALLLYTFDSTSSSSGSTVVNNSGSLGTTGSATLGSGCSIVSDSTSPFLGKALSISGSGLMSTASNIISTSDLNSLTISFWVEATSTINNWGGIVGYFNVSSTNNCSGWNIQSSGTGTAAPVRFRVWGSTSAVGGSRDIVSSTNLLSTTSWQQVTVTATGLNDGSGTLSVNYYLNGLLASSASTSNSSINTSNLQFLLGKLEWDSVLTAKYGYVALYDSALNATQVQMLYNTSIGEAVPEPATTVLTIIGAGGLLAFAWRKRRK